MKKTGGGRGADAFSVTGPDDAAGKKRYPTGMVALSSALTFACRAKGEATFYVRDMFDQVQTRVERDVHGNVRVFKSGVAA